MASVSKALSNDLNRCNCGLPAAQYPSLWYFLFHGKEAEKQAAASISGKCVPCYQIDLWIAECLRSPQNCEKSS
jgi:hypothetical protein